MKRILVYCLIITLLVGIHPTAFADNERKSGLYTYTIKGNGTITIVDYDWANSSGDIFIPSMLDGYTVTTIDDDAFANGDDQRNKSLVIPSTITMIGERAFIDTGFSTVLIPDSVMSIGTHAFNNVGKFIISSSHPKYAEIEGALYEKSGKKLVCYVPGAIIPEGIIRIDSFAVDVSFDYTFIDYGKEKTKYGKALTGSLPSTVTSVGDYAFCGLDYLDGENLPELETIGTGAFAAVNFRYSLHTSDGRYVNGLKSVPGSLKNIPNFGFWGVNVRSLEEGIEWIGDYAFAAVLPEDAPFRAAPRAFYDTYGTNRIFYRLYANEPAYSLPSSLKHIGNYAFAGKEYGANREYEGDIYYSIIIPDHVEFIGDYAFWRVDCSNGSNCKKRIELQGSTTTIGIYAFSEMKNAYDNKANQEKGFDVRISDGITALPEGVFMGTMINELDLPETIEYIGENAFCDTAALNTLTLPSSLKVIGDNAFKNSGLQSISVPVDSLLTSIGSNTFVGTMLSEVYLPATVESIGENAFDKTKVTLIVEENSYAALWAQENGYSYRYNGASNALDWLNN